VRIPIKWSAHATPSPPYAIDPPFFARVDQVLGWALEYKLAVILNIHHYDEIYADPGGHRERFLALWTQIAQHYASAPDSVMFELLNEPRDHLDQRRVNALYAEVVPLIRRTNPRRTIVMGASDWNSPAALPGLTLPDGETNVIGTFHMYYPFQFTHSGAEWTPEHPSAGAKWGGSPAEQQSVDQQFAAPRQWAQAHGLPIHMGEFGAYSRAELESRVRWTRHVVDTANSLGIPWSYWEFSSGFGVYDPDAHAYRKDLLQALLH
jgi:endoglucanase